MGRKAEELERVVIESGGILSNEATNWMYLNLLDFSFQSWGDVLQGPNDREVTPMPEVAPGSDMGIRKFIPLWTVAVQLPHQVCVHSQGKEQPEKSKFRAGEGETVSLLGRRPDLDNLGP